MPPTPFIPGDPIPDPSKQMSRQVLDADIPGIFYEMSRKKLDLVSILVFFFIFYKDVH